MADPTPPSTPAPDPTSSPDSGLNQAAAASLKKTEAIFTLALQPAYLAKLIETEEAPAPDDDSHITEAALRQGLLDLETCRKNFALAAVEEAGRGDGTDLVQTKLGALILLLQKIQARARQKFARKNPKRLQAYHVGDRLLQKRANFEQYEADIVTAAGLDKLPNIGPAFLTRVAQALADYKSAEQLQGKSGGASISARQLANDQLEELVDERMKVQFAVDAIWPWREDANHAIRAAFALPSGRPFEG